jgi:hypothetical protein
VVYTRKIAARFAVLKADAVSIWNAFWGVDEEDSTGDAAEKVADKLELRLWYAILDYWTAALFAALVIGMTAYGFSFWAIFATGWVFDFVVAMYFVIHEQVFKVDMTLGSDYRRAMDEMRGRRKWLWGVVLVAIIVKAAVWDGPEQIVMFFRKELHTWLRVTGIIFLLTAFQAWFWQVFWMTGYEVFVVSENSMTYLSLVALAIYANRVRKYFGRSA